MTDRQVPVKKTRPAKEENAGAFDPTDAAAVAAALRHTVGRFVRVVRSRSGTPTTAQSDVLAQLDRDGPTSVTRLAAARGVKHQSMRLVVSRLAELGLLELNADPGDRRSQRVSITHKGSEEIKKNQAARAAYLTELLKTKLSATELALLGDAVVLLERLSNNMD
ncbi:helix-turn-helix domain-containing protein [Rhodoferax sp.]|uniref:MarR family winged helix-turn-helix transcriptional regulator n=1 Tax=Rhodoferax sp. TaxID=50421 RepID=UPI0026350663|nr:helix-turn-helix domain-containing protein [Rhodoferax sp.]MDD2927223.1 helix-turn-helix domain-containing protein [Rhodoferax sp.]